MRNLHKWLLALGVATVLVTAIMFTQHSAKVNEQKLKSQMQKLEAQTKSQHDAEVENLKKKIQEQDSKYKELEQTKAAEKARIAAQEAEKRTLAQRVVQTAVPTAQASQVPVSGSKVDWMRAAGIPEAHWGMVDILVTRESGWDPNNWNGKSRGVPLSANTACGLGQQLPCGKWAGAWNDPVAALVAMTGYVNSRYGGWAGAVAFWNANHYY